MVVGSNAVAGAVVGSLAQQVRLVARIDSLTGLANRRAWDTALPRELARAKRSGRPLCVVVIDLDYFKQLNDNSGHHAGDQLLRAVASGFSAQLRAGDLLARLGGDELVAALSSCPVEEAARIVDRLRAVMPSGSTFSAGIAQWDGEEDVGRVVQRADAALYVAKREGRARTALAASGPAATRTPETDDARSSAVG